MNKSIMTLALAASLFASARAQNPLNDLSVAGTFEYESQYVFRGKKITNSAFQPKVEFGYPVYGASVYAGLWTNQPISTRSGVAQTNEIDIFGGVIYPLNMLSQGLSVDIGNTYYWYPEAGGTNGSAPPPGTNATSRTDETYIGFSYDTANILPGINLSPSLYYYRDWMLGQNVVELSVKYVWVLDNYLGVKGVSLVPRAYVGWLNATDSWSNQVAFNPPATPGGSTPNWRNSYIYYGVNLDLNYQINNFATAFVGFRYAGNNDGTGAQPWGATQTAQNGGTANNIWLGAGVKFSK